MKVLVLGGDGMLGHRVYLHLRDSFDVRCTLRGADPESRRFFEACRGHNYFAVDVRSAERLAEVIADFRPDVVVNCVGIVKQRDDVSDRTLALEINSLLPHRLAALCGISNTRLIHISTDCVFSGIRGGYAESDTADATDIYGRTKYLGEVDAEHCITLRTSIIGRELKNRRSLVEWFLAQAGTVKGFRNAVFSGFTTSELSRVIERVIKSESSPSGLWHVSSEPIDKFSLLQMLKSAFDKEIVIHEDSDFKIDRSLESSRFRRQFSYQPPSWQDMVDELSQTKLIDAEY
jgi:dTDP-4-dehydrorhamnose reductase